MKDKTNNLEKYNSMPVSQAVVKNAVPSMIAMVMVLVYNLADTFFIGQTHDALQVAAISLATPIFMLYMAVGTIFGMGGTSAISRALGEGRTEFAKKVCSFCMWSSVVVGIIMSAVIWIFMDPLVTALGASASTAGMVKNYLTIIIFAGPFLMISSAFSNILRAEGESGKAMIGTVVGNLLNIILDPIFISVFGWDVTGAAIATLIGNVIGGGYYLLYYAKGNSILSIHPKFFTMKKRVASGVLSIGIPASFRSLLMSVANIIVNGLIAPYGDMAVAGIGVALKVSMIAGTLCIGLGQGIQPLLGYCTGSGNWTRYKKTMKFSMWFGFILSIILTLLCYIFVEPITQAFLTDENAYDYAVSFTRILLSSGILLGMFYVINNALQALGAAAESLVVNICRQGIIYIPALFIMKAFMGIWGIVWAQPVADVLTMLVSIFLYLRASNKAMHPRHTDVNKTTPNVSMKRNDEVCFR